MSTHARCRNTRCVEPAHLVAIPEADHRVYHAAAQRQEQCSVHRRPYDRRDPKTGRGVCLPCHRESAARRRAAHPPKPLTQEQRARRNERDRRRRATPEGGAKARAREKARRATPEFRAKERVRDKRRREAKKAARAAA